MNENKQLLDDPQEWLNRAKSNLARSKIQREGIYLEDLCFDAQQAAEKAIKALLIHRGVEFPYVHDLVALLTFLEKSGQEFPDSIRNAGKLTRYAVAARYPGVLGPVTQEEYIEAVAVAERVVCWVEKLLNEST